MKPRNRGTFTETGNKQSDRGGRFSPPVWRKISSQKGSGKIGLKTVRKLTLIRWRIQFSIGFWVNFPLLRSLKFPISWHLVNVSKFMSDLTKHHCHSDMVVRKWQVFEELYDLETLQIPSRTLIKLQDRRHLPGSVLFTPWTSIPTMDYLGQGSRAHCSRSPYSFMSFIMRPIITRLCIEV